MALPRFRTAIKVTPVEREGKQLFVASDPYEGVFDHQVALPPIAFVVASFLDGERDAASVRSGILEQFPDAGVQEEDVRKVVEDLDQHYLLESERLAARRRDVEGEWNSLAARAAKFVDGSPEEVGKELKGYYSAEAGAGEPVLPSAAAPLSGILAPHIDFRRGGTCYTYAYRELAERSDAEVYVILGVAHASPPNPFVVTSKAYETAFGPTNPDRELIGSLEKRFGARIFENEILHRSEHSAEFQAVFLKHARPGADFTVLPILCSSFEIHCGTASPSTAPRIQEFLGALGEALRGRKACIVAGVDFAHVGPVFGDDVEVDQKLVEWMMAGDTRGLQECAEVNPEGFWNSVMADGNRRHVCGLSATYAALRLLDGAQGKVHKYGFAPDPGGGLVSFASMSFGPAPAMARP